MFANGSESLTSLCYHLPPLLPCRVCRYLPIADGDPNALAPVKKTTFAACAALCNYDPCEFVTYDYVTQDCIVREGKAPIYVG